MNIRKIGVIGRTYRHVQRYRQILTVLFRYGFGDLVEVLKIEQYLEIGLQMISKKRRERVARLTRAERLRMVLEELGPTFIKMGQLLSTRPDLLPMAFIQELPKLQDEIPPFSFSDVKKIIESELAVPFDQVFQRLDDEPLAAASIGQVHRAGLVNGEDVVVKVQRPNITQTIEVDLEIMLHLATLMERHLEGWDIHRPTQVVEEFARSLEKELDFRIEASHMETFARHFLSNQTLYVPKVYQEATTKRILTMEYVAGIKISLVDQLEKAGLDKIEIADRGAKLIMAQIFLHGFFHADPHPGNLFVLPNNVICYLDFGMMGRIGRQARESFAELMMNIVKGDESGAARAFQKLTTWDNAPEGGALERDMAEFMDLHFHQPLKDLKIGLLLLQLLDMASRHRLRLRPEFFLVLKALSTVEGLGQMLDPNFNIAAKAKPFLRKIQMEQVNPFRVTGDIFESGTELLRLFKEIPGEVREILRMIRRGKVKIEFEHRGLETLMTTFSRISNRIAFAIVLASLVVGSSLIVLSRVPPMWNEIPIIGLAGFILAGIMGFWLLVTILGRGKM